jgi:hypothetical protein
VPFLQDCVLTLILKPVVFSNAFGPSKVVP